MAEVSHIAGFILVVTQSLEIFLKTVVSSWLNLTLQYPPVVRSENSGRCADSRTCKWLQVCCRFHCSMQPQLTFFSLCVAPNSWMACLLISVQKLSKEMFWPLGTPICCRTWPKPSSFSTVCKQEVNEEKWKSEYKFKEMLNKIKDMGQWCQPLVFAVRNCALELCNAGRSITRQSVLWLMGQLWFQGAWPNRWFRKRNR